MNEIYQKLIELIETNEYTIEKVDCHDPQSGWSGVHYYVYDGDTLITDLSGNGYCFRESTHKRCLKDIQGYIAKKRMQTAEDFMFWCDEVAE